MKTLTVGLSVILAVTWSQSAHADGDCTSTFFGFSRDGTQFLYNHDCAGGLGMTLVGTVGSDETRRFGEQTSVGPRFFDRIPEIRALKLRKAPSQRAGWKGIVEKRGPHLRFALTKGRQRFELGSKEIEKGFRFTIQGLAWEHEHRAVAFKVTIRHASGTRSGNIYVFRAPSESALDALPDCAAFARLMRCIADRVPDPSARKGISRQMEDAIAKLEDAARQATDPGSKRDVAKACREGTETVRGQFRGMPAFVACFAR